MYPQCELSFFFSASTMCANSFMLDSNLALEKRISGKYMSVTSMQDAPGNSLESLT